MNDQRAMEIYVDDKKYLPDEEVAGSIWEVIRHLQPGLAAEERMIVEVRCDGQWVDHDDLGSALGQNPDDFERLDLVTAFVPEVASEALEAVLQILHTTRAKQAEIVDLLSADHFEEAVGTLRTCIEAWAKAQTSLLEVVKLLNLDIDTLTYDSVRLPDILTGIAHHLNQLKECLQVSDYVMLNDVMQYEILPSFDKWEGMVSAIREQIGGKPGSVGL